MKFGLFYELQLPKPYDKETWNPEDEYRIIQEMLEQVELADRLGFDYVFEVEHHFLEEYSHSSAPEVVLAAASQRTKQIRLGHSIVHMPPGHNHPARTAERLATLDLVSGGRVEFGTGEGASDMELGGFNTDRSLKKQMWEESTRECLRMMTAEPYAGHAGQFLQMPERNVIPKSLQKPHPPVWVAASRRETVLLAARLGIGSLGFGFETPDEAAERIERYYELIREECRPIGAAINPAVATVATMMCCPTNEEAVAKGLSGAQFFSFSLGRGTPPNPPRHPGRDHLYREFIDSRRAKAASRAAAVRDQEPDDEGQRALYRAGQRGGFIGSPDFIRENLKKYEAAHLDAMIFVAQCGDRRHEEIMASIELFAKEVMPEFQERHETVQRPWRAQQLEGVCFPNNSTI
jgi:alkanesulfonate monooxygenase SsuD/methylene tetrahydromethanopterin reductase-like flavin-dependent oxidoreductase (luciferase family)